MAGARPASLGTARDWQARRAIIAVILASGAGIAWGRKPGDKGTVARRTRKTRPGSVVAATLAAGIALALALPIAHAGAGADAPDPKRRGSEEEAREAAARAGERLETRPIAGKPTSACSRPSASASTPSSWRRPTSSRRARPSSPPSRQRLGELAAAGEDPQGLAQSAPRPDRQAFGRPAAHGPQPAAHPHHPARGRAEDGAQRHAARRRLPRARRSGPCAGRPSQRARPRHGRDPHARREPQGGDDPAHRRANTALRAARGEEGVARPAPVRAQAHAQGRGRDLGQRRPTSTS